MNINKVDFLDDLEKTISYFKNILNNGESLYKIEFYTQSNIDDEYKFNKTYTSFEDIDLTSDDYMKVEKITLIIKNNDYVKTVHCDKKNNIIAIADNKQKESVNKMIDEVDYSSIVKDDGCTYYEFEFNQIGKYNPLTSCYYLYEDGEWVISGTVMRWVEDPAYECKIIKEPNKDYNSMSNSI